MGWTRNEKIAKSKSHATSTHPHPPCWFHHRCLPRRLSSHHGPLILMMVSIGMTWHNVSRRAPWGTAHHPTPPHDLTDELADLRNFLSTWWAEWGKARNGNRAPDVIRTPEHDSDSDNGASHSNTHDYLDKASWIGVMIKAPAGERGWGTNAGGWLGFKTEDSLKHTGVTTEKWSEYMVHAINSYMQLL